MANIKSAIKRIKVTKRNTLENKLYSSRDAKYFFVKVLTLEEYSLFCSVLRFVTLIRLIADLIFAIILLFFVM